MRPLLSLLAFVVLMFMQVGSACAERRLAFVVGIDAYQNLGADAQLQRAVTDAETVGSTLSALGFTVTSLTRETVTQEVFLRRFGDFVRTIEAGDLVLFYFSGHGIGLNGANYLMPADVPALRAGDERLIRARAIAAAEVASDIRGKGARVAILVLDSCRNDPFTDAGHRSLSISRGFARIEPSDGVLTIYAASAGRQALDRLSDTGDPDPNSVFTRVFVKTLRRPGVNLSELGDIVRDDVASLARSAGQEQVPAVSNEIVGARSIFLGGSSTDASQPVVAAPVVPAPDRCGKLFDAARSIDTAQGYQAFLDQCPSDGFAAMAVAAKARLATAAASAPSSARSASQATVVATSDAAAASIAFPDGPPSFDCNRARSVVEHVICDAGSLGAADRRLNSLFEQLSARLNGDGLTLLTASQSGWLAQREQCAAERPGAGQMACVRQAYDRRSAELGQMLSNTAAARLGPSFDCTYARAPAERVVCTDDVLAARDRQLAEVFNRRTQSLSVAGRRSLATDEAGWRAARNTCGQRLPEDVRACVLSAYDRRIRELAIP